MIGGHTERAHAMLSPSSAHMWLKCTPSAKLSAQFPDTTSSAAAEGTLAHEICEAKLQHYFNTKDYSKRKLTSFINKCKKNELWDDEMVGHTDTYSEYVKDKAMAYENAPFVQIEASLDLSTYIAEPGARGTADCLLIGGDTLTIIDFKYGKGVPVSAEFNPQLMIYALGAYSTYSMLFDIKRVKLCICQPRIDNSNEWEVGIEELLSFGEYVKKRSEKAFNGVGEYAPGESQCRFCRAKAQCRARADRNLELAGFTAEKPPLLSNDEVGEYLKKGEDVAKWLSDLKDYALSECLAGKEVAGWKAVEGRGSRVWTDADAAFKELIDSGTPEEMLYERKQLTLAGVEKLLGKKEFESKVGKYVDKKPGKPALVVESDKRQAITNTISAEDAFK